MFRFLFDRNVPFIKKLPVLGWLVYLISPIDALPDPVFGVGIIDDFVILLFLLSFMSQQLEKYAGKKNKSHPNNENIIEDVEYKVEQDEDEGNSG